MLALYYPNMMKQKDSKPTIVPDKYKLVDSILLTTDFINIYQEKKKHLLD